MHGGNTQKISIQKTIKILQNIPKRTCVMPSLKYKIKSIWYLKHGANMDL